MALSYKNDEQQDERLSPYSDSVKQLRDQENSGSDYDRSNDGLDDHPVSHGDASGKPGDLSGGPSKNIDDAKDKEERAGNWTYNGTGNNKQPATGRIRALKKKGPMVLIITLLLGGGFGIFGPAALLGGALIHAKEVVVQKIDSMSSVVGQRSGMIMGERTLNTSTTCAIKVRCRYSGLTQRQMDRLNANGGQLLDKDGKPVTRNELTRKYTGGETLKLGDGTIVKAGDYKGALLTSSNLRDLNRSVYAPRWMSWNDKISKDIRAKKKLVTKPDWGSDSEDQKTKDKAVRKSITKTQTPDAALVERTGINSLDQSSDITDEASKLQTSAAAGDIVDSVPSDPLEVTQLPENTGSVTPGKGFRFVTSSLNGTGLISNVCLAFTYANTLVVTAKLVQLSSTMIYASQFLSTADKIKAGDATSGEVEKAMTILERQDKVTGDAFGDSTGYQWSEYGKVPSKPITSSANGNATTNIISGGIGGISQYLGGKSAIKAACKTINNMWVQGSAALVGVGLSIFSGGSVNGASAAIGAAQSAGQGAAKTAIKKVIDKFVANSIEAAKNKAEKYTTVKGAAATGLKDLRTIAKGPVGIFFAMYMLDRYGIPYLAHQIAGVGLTGDEDGVTAMDAITNGADATNSATAQQRGLTPLKKDEYTAFNNFNKNATATYVADMRSKSNPLDLNDPYSDGNTMASAYQMFTSKLGVFKNGSFNFISAPSAILSSLNPASIISSSVHADNTSDELSVCEDSYLQSQNLATSPFCNVKYGFNDMNMLQNTDPEAVVQYMLDKKQIDENGDPVADSHFADFKAKCIDGNENKFIGDEDDPSINIDEQCYGEKNKTEEYKMFRLYIIDSGINDGMDNPPSATSADAAGADSSTTPVTGDTKTLAKQIIDSPNVQFQTPDGKVAFQHIVDTGHAIACNATAISSDLLSLIATASQRYKITIGTLTDGHGCDGGRHSRGGAVDFTGVAHLDQPFMHMISYTSDQIPIAKEFYEYLDSISQPGKLGLGQSACFGGNTPNLKKVAAGNFFIDDCTHMHVDVRN